MSFPGIMSCGQCSLLLVQLSILIILSKGACGSEAEYNLLQKLFERYNPSNRPVQNASDVVLVSMDLAIHQIIDLDEKNELLKTKLWVRLFWQDAHLHWDPARYGQLRQVHVVPSRIWKPDITLYQDVSEMNNVHSYHQSLPAIITWEGHVTWAVPYVYYSSCNLDVRYFPFDEQRCPLTFGSWTYPITELDMVALRIATLFRDYMCNAEWLLIGLPVTHNVKEYGSPNDSSRIFVDLTYLVVIRRMPLYYIFNLVFPCSVITATAILVFCLPPGSGEKVNLGVTVLLTLTVFLLLVAQSVPSQSVTVPLAGEYFAATIVLLALSTALTVLSLNLHHRGALGVEVPVFMRTVFLDWLAVVVFMKSHVTKFHQQRTKLKYSNSSVTKNGSYKHQKKSAVGETNHMGSSASTTTPGGITVTCTQEAHPLKHHLEEIVDILRQGQHSVVEREVERVITTEWVLVARVADRLLFVVFVVLTAVVSLSILLQRPSYTHLPPISCNRPE